MDDWANSWHVLMQSLLVQILKYIPVSMFIELNVCILVLKRTFFVGFNDIESCSLCLPVWEGIYTWVIKKPQIIIVIISPQLFSFIPSKLEGILGVGAEETKHHPSCAVEWNTFPWHLSSCHLVHSMASPKYAFSRVVPRLKYEATTNRAPSSINKSPKTPWQGGLLELSELIIWLLGRAFMIHSKPLVWYNGLQTLFDLQWPAHLELWFDQRIFA